MMAGPLALLGGMEHLPVFHDADRNLLDLVGVPQPRVAVVPAASTRRKRSETAALARGYWAGLGTQVSVALPGRDLGHAIDAVNDADVIVLTGGHPNLLLGALGASPLWDHITRRWLAGAALSGSSAGAMALFQWRIHLYPPDPLKLIPGLGLVHGYVAAPHFDRLRGRRWGRSAAHRLGRQGVLGIDEGTALLGHGKRFGVVGAGDVVVIDGDEMSIHPAGSEVDLDLVPAGFVSGRVKQRQAKPELALA